MGKLAADLLLKVDRSREERIVELREALRGHEAWLEVCR